MKNINGYASDINHNVSVRYKENDNGLNGYVSKIIDTMFYIPTSDTEGIMVIGRRNKPTKFVRSFLERAYNTPRKMYESLLEKARANDDSKDVVLPSGLWVRPWTEEDDKYISTEIK